jgi:hypothetical protein
MNNETAGIKDDFAAREFDTLVAWIMGRNAGEAKSPGRFVEFRSGRSSM